MKQGADQRCNGENASTTQEVTGILFFAENGTHAIWPPRSSLMNMQRELRKGISDDSCNGVVCKMMCAEAKLRKRLLTKCIFAERTGPKRFRVLESRKSLEYCHHMCITQQATIIMHRRAKDDETKRWRRGGGRYLPRSISGEQKPRDSLTQSRTWGASK